MGPPTILGLDSLRTIAEGAYPKLLRSTLLQLESATVGARDVHVEL